MVFTEYAGASVTLALAWDYVNSSASNYTTGTRTIKVELVENPIVSQLASQS